MTNQAEFDFNARPEAKSPPPAARAEIVEKIKKLLRLGQSSNPAEAALAMQRAFELANRHAVDVESLNLDEQLEEMVHQYFHCGERISLLRMRVLGILHHFKVEVCICGARVLFVGRESDVAIAGYVYDFLVWAGSKALRDFSAVEKKARRKATSRKKRSFTEGFIYGVASKLEGAAERIVLPDSHTALAVSEEAARKTEMDRLCPNRVDRRRRKAQSLNDGALTAGWIHGRNTSIHTPLNGGGATLALQ